MNERIINAVKDPLKEIGVTVSNIELAKEDGEDTLFLHIESENVCITKRGLIEGRTLIYVLKSHK